MNRNIEVITEPFREEEIYLILKQYPKKKSDLKFYQETDYFQIHKLYYHHFFLGYAVIFLGYNSLESRDALIEDILFLSNPELLPPLMTYLLQTIKRKSIINYPIDELYYIEENTNPIYFPIFASLNIKQTEKQKCQA